MNGPMRNLGIYQAVLAGTGVVALLLGFFTPEVSALAFTVGGIAVGVALVTYPIRVAAESIAASIAADATARSTATTSRP